MSPFRMRLSIKAVLEEAEQVHAMFGVFAMSFGMVICGCDGFGGSGGWMGTSGRIGKTGRTGRKAIMARCERIDLTFFDSEFRCL